LYPTNRIIELCLSTVNGLALHPDIFVISEINDKKMVSTTSQLVD